MSAFCIAILSYNHPEITARAVQSALPFLDSHMTKILLIHNGSEVKHVRNLQSQFPQFNHLIKEKNAGYSGGVNFAFQEAMKLGFQWIFLLTNDCVIHEIQIPVIGLTPSLITPHIYRRKLNQTDSCGGFFSPLEAKIYHLKTQDEFQAMKSRLKSQTKKNNYLYAPGSAFWIHREVISTVGSLDESLGTYWEDVDFSVRAHRKNFEIHFDENTKIIHQIGKTNHKLIYYTTYLYLRNRSRISRRYLQKNFINQLTLNLRLHIFWIKTLTQHLYSGNQDKLKLTWKAYLDSYSDQNV